MATSRLSAAAASRPKRSRCSPRVATRSCRARKKRTRTSGRDERRTASNRKCATIFSFRTSSRCSSPCAHARRLWRATRLAPRCVTCLTRLSLTAVAVCRSRRSLRPPSRRHRLPFRRRCAACRRNGHLLPRLPLLDLARCNSMSIHHLQLHVSHVS